MKTVAKLVLIPFIMLCVVSFFRMFFVREEFNASFSVPYPVIVISLFVHAVFAYNALNRKSN
jgi:hypothetical protein